MQTKINIVTWLKIIVVSMLFAVGAFLVSEYIPHGSSNITHQSCGRPVTYEEILKCPIRKERYDYYGWPYASKEVQKIQNGKMTTDYGLMAGFPLDLLYARFINWIVYTLLFTLLAGIAVTYRRNRQ